MFQYVIYPNIIPNRYKIDNETAQVYDTLSNQFISVSSHPQGYLRVNLRRIDGTFTSVFLHVLVASTFLGGYHEDLVVNHKDGNKLNNAASNLEWITRAMNVVHAFMNGLMKQGTTDYKKIENAIQLLSECYSPTEVMRYLELSKAEFDRIVNPNMYKHIKGDTPVVVINPSRSLPRDAIFEILNLDRHTDWSDTDISKKFKFAVDRKTVGHIRRGDRYYKVREYYNTIHKPLNT